MLRSLKPFILLAVLLLVFSTSIFADSFIKQVAHIKGYEMMGQRSPEKYDTTTIWMSKDKSYAELNNTNGVIYDMNTGIFTVVDHAKKEYSKFSMDILNKPASGDNHDMMQMKQMAQMMTAGMTVSVTPTDSTKKVGKWDTKLYIVEVNMKMMPMKQRLWVTEELDIDYEMYRSISNAMMSLMPGFEKIFEEMKKIKGVAVEMDQTVSVMGTDIGSSTTVIEYEQKDAPAGTYDIPEGFKEVELDLGMNGMGGMGN